MASISLVSAGGQSLPGRLSSNSGHVRYAPKGGLFGVRYVPIATKFCIAAECRDGPLADDRVSEKTASHSSRNDTPLSFLMRAIRLPTPAAEWKAPPPTRPAALA